jgi:acetyl-CoA acetyltransferase
VPRPARSTSAGAADGTCLFSHYVAPLIFEAAGVTATDIDVAMLYDAYSPLVLAQLEDFGFCGRGGGGALARAGEIGPDGAVPVNPHGGLLSEGSLHGFNNVLEAVRQLRGTASANQIPGVGLALVTGFGGSYGSAAVLERS